MPKTTPNELTLVKGERVSIDLSVMLDTDVIDWFKDNDIEDGIGIVESFDESFVWLNGCPYAIQLDYVETEEVIEKRDMASEVSSHLKNIFININIDRPSNFDEIVSFIVVDVASTADKNLWHTGDIEIGFRRYLESKS